MDYKREDRTSPHGSRKWGNNNLSLVVDGFSCKPCDDTIQEADLAEGLVVGGDTYGSVKSFCYL